MSRPSWGGKEKDDQAIPGRHRGGNSAGSRVAGQGADTGAQTVKSRPEVDGRAAVPPGVTGRVMSPHVRGPPGPRSDPGGGAWGRGVGEGRGRGAGG